MVVVVVDGSGCGCAVLNASVSWWLPLSRATLQVARRNGGGGG